MLISISEAKKIGKKTYFTGAACPKGHVSERRVHNSECVECGRLSSLKRYRLNRKANIARMRKYSKENPQKERLRRKKYRDQNREKTIRATAKWYAQNKKRAKEYRIKNSLKYRAYDANRRARVKSAKGKFSDKDIKKIFINQRGLCVGIGCRELLGDSFHVDHIMPIALGGSNWPVNLQLLCPPCNYSKNDTHPDKWLGRIRD